MKRKTQSPGLRLQVRCDPTLETERLILRPYRDDDAAELLPLIGTAEVAATTLRISHPYTEYDARAFFHKTKDPDKIWLAITRRPDLPKEDARQIGGIGLMLDLQHQHGEVGYWLAVPFWRQGYATEAAQAMVRHGFETLGLHRIHASHFSHNSASGKILLKLGMQHEGRQREHLRKGDRFVNSELYGILRHEWESR